jgi:hypothetical protein
MKEKTTAAPIRWPWPGCLDALEAAPRHHRLLSENDRVRVLEVRIPGANMFAATERAGWSSIRARLGTCPRRIPVVLKLSALGFLHTLGLDIRSIHEDFRTLEIGWPWNLPRGA